MKTHTVKDEGRQSHLSFMSYYYVTSMQFFFHLNTKKKTSASEIRVPYKRHHVNHIN